VSGNVWNELEPMIGRNFATKQSVETRFIASPQRAETRSNSFHTLQRTAGRRLKTEDDTRRPKLIKTLGRKNYKLRTINLFSSIGNKSFGKNEPNSFKFSIF